MFTKYGLETLLWLFAIVFITLTACTAPQSIENLATATSLLVSTDIATTVATPAIAVTDMEVIAIPMASATSTKRLEPTVTITSTPSTTPTVIASPTILLQNTCPKLVEVAAPIAGNILFNTGKMFANAPTGYLDVETPGIWAISSTNLSPKLINQNLPDAVVSPDGTMLFYVTQTWEPTEEAIFINLRSSEAFSLEFSPKPGLFKAITWLEDGRVRYEIVTEMVEGKDENRKSFTFNPAPTYADSTDTAGETRQVFIFDPITRQVEQYVENLSLPEYTFYSDNIGQGIPSGYASIDPTRRFILYTAMRNSDNVAEVRLLDMQTENIIWRQVTKFIPDTTVEWDASGDKVLFQLYEPIEGSNYSRYKVVSLTRDGQEEELPPQPFPGPDEISVTTLTRSSSGQYIFYSIVDSSGITHGFLIDTITHEISELCGPWVDMVTSFQNEIEGLWLPDNRFVYNVLVRKGDQLAHSLYILDITDWTTQMLIESEPGYGINIVGWTPVEFP